MSLEKVNETILKEEIASLKEKIRRLEEKLSLLSDKSGPNDPGVEFHDADECLDYPSMLKTLTDLKQANRLLKNELAQRQRVEELLAESEERYRLLFNNSNDMVFLHWVAHDSFLGEPLEVNDVCSRILGYSKDELLMATTSLIPQEMNDILLEAKKMLLKEKRALFQIRMLTKSGSSLLVEFNSNLFDLKGQPTILSVVRDITPRQKKGFYAGEPSVRPGY